MEESDVTPVNRPDDPELAHCRLTALAATRNMDVTRMVPLVGAVTMALGPDDEHASDTMTGTRADVPLKTKFVSGIAATCQVVVG